MKRFWDKVEKTDNCWNWIGANKAGYGAFSYKNISYLAHRFAWYLIYGKFPTENLLHSCDNPICVRPDHLREGTQKDNIQDALKKGRMKTIENFGKAFYNQQGEKNPIAKLTNMQALEIRTRYIPGQILQKDLAKEYGVDPKTISNCVRKKTYK